MLMGAIFALLVNNLMISMNASHRHPDFIPADFYSSSSGYIEERPEITPSSLDEGRRLQTNDDHVQRLRHPRILFGIFSSDSDFDASHRLWHRQLIGIWNDERVCSLDKFRFSSNNTSFRQKCEVLYTFVVGAHSDPNVPMERLEDTDTADNPIEFQGKIQSSAKDINLPDVTLLNIR